MPQKRHHAGTNRKHLQMLHLTFHCAIPVTSARGLAITHPSSRACDAPHSAWHCQWQCHRYDGSRPTPPSMRSLRRELSPLLEPSLRPRHQRCQAYRTKDLLRCNPTPYVARVLAHTWKDCRKNPASQAIINPSHSPQQCSILFSTATFEFAMAHVCVWPAETAAHVVALSGGITATGRSTSSKTKDTPKQPPLLFPTLHSGLFAFTFV